MRKMTKMTPLRRQMLDAMLLRGFAARTQESYCDAVIALAKPIFYSLVLKVPVIQLVRGTADV